MMNNNRPKISLDGKWQLSWFKNSEYDTLNPDLSTIENIEKYNFNTVSATVPGNFELDLFANGIIDDPYFGTNTLKMQDFECMHMVYYRTFEICGEFDTANSVLCFDAVDTISDIYVNGNWIGETDNMFIPYMCDDNYLQIGTNEIIVHIKPATIEARKYEVQPSTNAMKYNSDSLYIRKAPHMYRLGHHAENSFRRYLAQCLY